MAVGSLLVAAAALWFAYSGGVAQPSNANDPKLASLITELENEAAASRDREIQFNQMMGNLKQRVTNYRPSDGDASADKSGEDAQDKTPKTAANESTEVSGNLDDVDAPSDEIPTRRQLLLMPVKVIPSRTIRWPAIQSAQFNRAAKT